MDIEYDPRKAESNLKKHGVSFGEAATALLDPMALMREDDDAQGEARYVLVGMSNAGHPDYGLLYLAQRREHPLDFGAQGDQQRTEAI